MDMNRMLWIWIECVHDNETVKVCLNPLWWINNLSPADNSSKPMFHI